ncbi:MAG: hypothetical protein KDA85_06390, partial [Planctomycetaceae bacterium]|nr:hypothetical protein [Planctomycetaceae bacterium]
MSRRGEFGTLLTATNAWIRQMPGAEAWSYHLRALVENDRPDDVMQLLHEWFDDALASNADEPLDRITAARLEAAMEFGFGRLAGLELAGPEQRVAPQMLQIAEHFALSERNLDIADRILGHSGIGQTSDGQLAMKRILTRASTQLSGLSERQLTELLSWTQHTNTSSSEPFQQVMNAIRRELDQSLDTMPITRAMLLLVTWNAAAPEENREESDSNVADSAAEQLRKRHQRWSDLLIARWSAAETDSAERKSLASLIDTLETLAFDETHRLQWHRRCLQDAGSDAERTLAATVLFQTLLLQPWTAETEQEPLELISLAGPVPQAGSEWLAQRARLLSQWVSSMLAARVRAKIEADEQWKERTPAQQQTLQRQFRVSALRELRSEFRQRVITAISVQPSTETSTAGESTVSLPISIAELAGLWEQIVTVQDMGLALQLARSESTAGVTDDEKRELFGQLIEDVRAHLGDVPPLTPDPNRTETDRHQAVIAQLHLQLRHTHFAIWLDAAMQLQEKHGIDNATEPILAYVRRGQQVDTVAPRIWKAAEYGILLAQDRTEELIRRLQDWYRDDQRDDVWRVHLGMLLAELDQLEEAVRLYEQAGQQDLLTWDEWNRLAVWQHALDRRDDMEESQRQAESHWPVNMLQSQVNQDLQQWKNNSTTRTPTVGSELRRRMQRLMQATSDQTATINLLSQWYQATHDPLILDSVAGYVLGRDQAGMFAAADALW